MKPNFIKILHYYFRWDYGCADILADMIYIFFLKNKILGNRSFMDKFVPRFK